jgi:hypothetical protein
VFCHLDNGCDWIFFAAYSDFKRIETMTMKIFRKNLVMMMLLTVTIFAVSCDDNEEIQVDPNAGFDAVLDVKEVGTANPNVDVAVDANTASTIKAKVSFTSTTKSMTRLYITQNIKGAGETIYEPIENIDLKADGAIDIETAKKNGFEYAFTLPVPAGVGVGTVVYKFWTTDGNGDPRDQTKRLAVGPGTITLKFGAATNPAAAAALLKSFSAKILASPLADGTSSTFISLVNGDLYKIKDGAEYASFWDFGYYYTGAEKASLSSTFNYEAAFPFVHVATIAGTTDLNKAFFALSTKTSADFDAAVKAGDLTFTAPTAQKVVGLLTGNIVEFVDNYGKKGLIRVVEVKGTTGAADYIKIDIKVQP